MRARSTSSTNRPGRVLSKTTSSGVASIASPRWSGPNRFCVVITTARFSMARDQMRLRHDAHSRSLSTPAGRKTTSAPSQRQRSADLGHVDLAAHRQPEGAVLRREDREVVARHVLEVPVGAARVDPRPGWVRPPVPAGHPARGRGQQQHVVRAPALRLERLEGAELDVHAVLPGRLHHRPGRVVAAGHAPRPRIRLREGDHVGARAGGGFDVAHRVRHVALVVGRAVRQGLDQRETEAHQATPSRRARFCPSTRASRSDPSPRLRMASTGAGFPMWKG